MSATIGLLASGSLIEGWMTVYTAPSSRSVALSSIRLTNRSAEVVTVNVSLKKAGGVDRMISPQSLELLENTTFEVGSVGLSEGDALRVNSDAGGVVDYNVVGVVVK